MFIVAPISRVSEVGSIIEAGAGEIYCGLLTPEQRDSYANVYCLNRRAEVSSNLTSYDELREVVRIANQKNIPVNLALNEFYDQGQANAALKQLEKAMDCGINRFIVSDIGLLAEISKRKYSNLHLQISSCASVFNSSAVQFYRMFNPSRIILTRQLTISEIEHIHNASPELEKEVFILNERCYNVDGLCTFLHGRLSPKYNIFIRRILGVMQNRNIKYIPTWILQSLHRHVVKNSLSCCFPYSVKNILIDDNIENSLPEERIFLNEPKFFLKACGVCALYNFHTIGVKFIKISGRSLLADKIQDIHVLKKTINILSDGLTMSNFKERIKEMAKHEFRRACSPEYCYYD